jgi:hypothetical protein
MADPASDASGSEDEWSKAEQFVIQKTDELVDEFDRCLDPFELFYGPSSSLPPRVKMALNMTCADDELPTYPPQLTEALGHAYSVFMSVSFKEECGAFLPSNWAEVRPQLEAAWPCRARFFRCIRQVLKDFSVNHVDELQEHYHKLWCRGCWELVRQRARLLRIVKFWVHLANRPGSTGFHSSVEACQDLMGNPVTE